MTWYVLGRLCSTVVLFFAVTLLVFVMFFALPRTAPREREITDAYRIHGSMGGQYAHYVWRFVRHGDLGYSYENHEAVTTRLFRAAPVTLSLVAGGLVVWLLIAIPLGLLAAVRPRSLTDRVSTVFVLAGLSAHPVWLGLLLSYLFGHSLHVLPPSGYCSLANLSTGCDGLSHWTSHMLLPWVTFGVVNAALFSSMARAFVLEELGADYVQTARAKGLGDGRIVRAHVLRNVTAPLLTVVSLNLATALGGVVFIESAFNLPGLGGLLRQSTLRRDVPMIAGSVLFLALAITVLNLLVDVAYAMLDPRLRAASRTPQRA
jgi:peptide/nickel transport system permease protein